MIRTQVRLTEVQLKALRQLSSATGKSTAELIRCGVDQLLAERHVANAEVWSERAVRVAGRFSSGTSDGSSEHGRHLAEAFKR
jgi:hypothetical protein